jgi:hypothetical protein
MKSGAIATAVILEMNRTRKIQPKMVIVVQKKVRGGQWSVKKASRVKKEKTRG